MSILCTDRSAAAQCRAETPSERLRSTTPPPGSGQQPAGGAREPWDKDAGALGTECVSVHCAQFPTPTPSGFLYTNGPPRQSGFSDLQSLTGPPPHHTVSGNPGTAPSFLECQAVSVGSVLVRARAQVPAWASTELAPPAHPEPQFPQL